MECSTKDKLEHIVGSHKGKAGDSTAKKSATCPSAGAKSTGKTEWETARGGGREDDGFLLSSLCLCVMLNKSAFGKYVNC